MAKLQKNTIDKKELLADIERIKKSKNASEIDAIMAKYEKGLAEMDRRNAKKAEAQTESKKPIAKKPEVKKAEAQVKPKTARYNGKYEVYQAADGYAYRLKASNGKVLVTSEIYTTRDGILKAINTVKKNVEVG